MNRSSAPAPSAAPRSSRRWLAAGGGLASVGALIAVFAFTDPFWQARFGRGVPALTETRRSTWTMESIHGAVTGWTDQVALKRGSGGALPLVDLAVDPTSGGVFAADMSGRLRSMPSSSPAEVGNPFTGLLAGLAPLDDGRTALLLGKSGYGSDYFIRLPGTPDVDIPLGFCTRLLATDGTTIFYATKQARLGCISGHGERLWEIVLPQVPSSLVANREGRVLVGDDRGGITLVGPGGAIEQAFSLGGYPITAVAFARNGTALIAVDRAGAVGWFDRSGKRYGDYQSGAGNERILSMVEIGRSLHLVTARGQAFRLELPELTIGLSLPALRMLRVGSAFLFGVLAVIGFVSFSRRTTRTVRETGRRLAEARIAYLLLLPTFLLLAVFNFYPMATALGYSFWKFSLTSPMEFAGLDNFREMAADPYVRGGVVNMAILLVTGVIKLIVFPLLAAELVFWLSSPRLQQFFRAIVTFPAVVPGVVMVLVWKMIYDPYNGLLNLLLRAVGLGNLGRAWLGDEHSALWAVVCFNFPWINLLIFLIFLGGLLQIDRNLFEAADIDGASVRQRFLHIDLPALRPKLHLAVTLIFLWSVQDYASVLILTGGGPGVSTYVPALQMFQLISGGLNLGYSSAIGLVLFALVLAFTYFSRRHHGEDGA